MLKEMIKQLAEEQKALKKARKTGTHTHGYYVDGTTVRYRAAPPEVVASWQAASKVRDNKIKITAALNLYHEIRGSDYRHNISTEPYWYDVYYTKYLEEFRSMLSLPKKDLASN